MEVSSSVAGSEHEGCMLMKLGPPSIRNCDSIDVRAKGASHLASGNSAAAEPGWWQKESARSLFGLQCRRCHLLRRNSEECCHLQ